MARREVEDLEPREFVVKDREIRTIEFWVAIAWLAFGAVPLVIGWAIVYRRGFNLQEFTYLTLLGLYVFSLVETFAIIFYRGIGRLDLSESFLKWLGGTVFAQVLPLVGFVLKQLFL